MNLLDFWDILFFGIDYLVVFCKGRIFPGQACLR